MTSKDYLSQEEIEALLKSQESDQEDETPLDLGQFLTASEQASLTELSNQAMAAVSSTLSVLLANKAGVTSPKISAFKRSVLSKQFAQPGALLSVNYNAGLAGSSTILLLADDAQVIADLMHGGTGKIEQGFEISDEQLTAVRDVAAQWFSASSSALGNRLKQTIEHGEPVVDRYDFTTGQADHLVAQEDVLLHIAYDLKIGTLVQSKVAQILTVTAVKELLAALQQANAPSASATPTAAQPETPQAPQAADFGTPSASPSVNASAPYGTPYPPQFNQPQAPARDANVSAQRPDWQNFNSGPQLNPFEANNLNMLMHIPLKLTVELGRTQKLIRDILDLSQGSIVELDKLAGEPVDILVNDQLIAKGEVVVIDENFGVRVTEIITQWDRIQKLR
jgi:flagellar motor switch protein FliN/FliY